MEKLTKDEFIDQQAASKFLKVALGTLYIKVSQGEIPVYKFKGCQKNLYKLSDLENLLKIVA